MSEGNDLRERPIEFAADEYLPPGQAHSDGRTAPRDKQQGVALHRGTTNTGRGDGLAHEENAEAAELTSRSRTGQAERRAGPAGREIGLGLAGIPKGVQASAAASPGEYDARRLRSQREVIRDVMLSAADCETWLTLGELRALTRYGEASISAQLRHLRKAENGGYGVVKRHREGVSPERPGTDGRGECVWEYRLTQSVTAGSTRATARLQAVGA